MEKSTLKQDTLIAFVENHSLKRIQMDAHFIRDTLLTMEVKRNGHAAKGQLTRRANVSHAKAIAIKMLFTPKRSANCISLICPFKIQESIEHSKAPLHSLQNTGNIAASLEKLKSTLL